MKKQITLLVFAFCLATASAQNLQLTPTVQPTQGGHTQVGNFSLGYTIGEPVFTPLKNGNLMLTQGFEQPRFGGDDDDYAWTLFDHTGALIAESPNGSELPIEPNGTVGRVYLSCDTPYTINFTDGVFDDLCSALYCQNFFGAPSSCAHTAPNVWQMTISSQTGYSPVPTLFNPPTGCGNSANCTAFQGWPYSFLNDPHLYGLDNIFISGIDNSNNIVCDIVHECNHSNPLQVVVIPNDWPMGFNPVTVIGNCACEKVCFFANAALNNSALSMLSIDYGDGSAIDNFCQPNCMDHTCHYYTVPGTYTAIVTLTSPEPSYLWPECYHPATDSVQVTVVAPTANFTSSITGCNTVSFTNTSACAPDAVVYHWSFGDGTNSTATNPVHTYSNSGNYTVTLSYTDGCNHTVTPHTNSINIPALPVVNISVSNLMLCGANNTATLTATSGFTNYVWSNSTTSNPITISTAGAYTVTVTDANFCTASSSTPEIYNCCPGDNYTTACPSTLALTFTDITSSALSSLLCINNVLSLGNTTITFNGTFTINNNFSISSCGNVTFGRGARIVIEHGQKLIIKGSHLYSCDNNLWKGIEVPGNTNPASIDITASIIEDALYAVETFDGSSVYFTGNTFNKCFIGLYFHGSPNVPASQSLRFINAFANNNFTCKTPNGSLASLLAAYPGMATNLDQPTVAQIYQNANPVTWAGIHLYHLKTFNCLTTTFDKVANGIVAVNCNLNVNKCKFNDILPYNYNSNQGNGILSSCKYAVINSGLGGVPVRSLIEVGYGNNNASAFTFTNCRRGIVADNMDVYISYTKMDCGSSCGTVNSEVGIRVSNSKWRNILIHRNVITYSNNGIQLLQNDPVRQAKVYLNTINISAPYSIHQPLNGIGITVQEKLNLPLLKAEYFNNTINVNSNAVVGAWFNSVAGAKCYNNHIHLNNPVNSIAGILFQNNRKLLDETNYVNSTFTGNAVLQNSHILTNYPVGIWYANNQNNMQNEHRCNTTEDIYTGMLFAGTNDNSLIHGNKFNPNTTSTIINRMNTGLLVDGTATIVEQYNAGNKWYGVTAPPIDPSDPTYMTHWAENDNTQLNILTQIFYSSGTPGDNLWPNVDPNPIATQLFPYAGWFQSQIGTEYTCSYSSTSPVCVNCGHLTALDLAVVNNSLEFANFEGELKYMNETGTYKKLKYNTALLDSSTAADSFYTAKAGSAMELLERVDSIRMSAMPDSVTVDNWNNRSSIADSLSYEAMLIDSILSDTSSTLKQSDIDDYLLQKQLFENFIDSTQALTNSDGVYFKALKDSTITQALLVNSSVTTGNTIEANQKLLNSIYLNTVAVDSVQFDSATLSNLYNLAFQCPYTGGYAVYEARSVLALIKDTFYIDEDICTISYKTDGSEKTVRPKKDTLIEEGITITMYPNPAKDYVLLSFSKQTTNPMQLRITDMIGRRVADVPIIVLGNSYQINTSALSNGIYYVNVYDSKNKLFGDKLSILR